MLSAAPEDAALAFASHGGSAHDKKAPITSSLPVGLYSLSRRDVID